MLTKKFKRYIWLLHKVSIIVFILFSSFSILVSLLESFTYVGFFLKHFHLSLKVFIYVNFLSGILIFLTGWNNEGKYKSKTMWVFSKINLLFFLFISVVTIITNFIEKVNYPNFVYTYVHLQPQLLYKPIIISGFGVLVSLSIVFRASLLKWLYRFSKPRINYLSLLTKTRHFVYYIFTVILVIFTLSNSATHIKSFYEIEKGFKQENEAKYALRQIDIYQWIEEYFPLTKDVIFWCEKQEKPVELVSFDPQIIWNSYEGLSRVFLTNCNYANIGSLNKSSEYLKKETLLLVSITPCDPNIKVGNNVELELDVMEYFKLVNNNYICNSKEIIPGLYLYSKDENDRRI